MFSDLNSVMGVVWGGLGVWEWCGRGCWERSEEFGGGKEWLGKVGVVRRCG